jgi:hypothetical protein
VPVSVTDCVDPGVAPLSSVKVSEAVRAPIAVGVKVTLQAQFFVAATVTVLGSPAVQPTPGVTLKSEEFVPVITTPVMFNTSVPSFVSVPFCAALDVLTS